jgi:hypothetical protein
MSMKRMVLGVVTCAIIVLGGAVSAQAAGSSGSPGNATPNVAPAKMKGCKHYKMYEESRALSGGLSLCKGSKLWSMSGLFSGEAGFYEFTGPEIVLWETSRAGFEECVFLGVKGKKKVVYTGTWECYLPELVESISGNWEAVK